MPPRRRHTVNLSPLPERPPILPSLETRIEEAQSQYMKYHTALASACCEVAIHEGRDVTIDSALPLSQDAIISNLNKIIKRMIKAEQELRRIRESKASSTGIATQTEHPAVAEVTTQTETPHSPPEKNQKSYAAAAAAVTASPMEMEIDAPAPPTPTPAPVKPTNLTKPIPKNHSPFTQRIKTRAIVVHGVNIKALLPKVIRGVEIQTKQVAMGARWLLSKERREGKSESSVVVYFFDNIECPGFFWVGGRKKKVEVYDWHRGKGKEENGKGRAA